MSRSGYSDDLGDEWKMIRWRGAVNSAIHGKRGQSLLRDLRDALDSMPEKRLIAGELVESDGEVCVLGRLAQVRGIDVSAIDIADRHQVANAFGIAHAMFCEIVNENDEGNWLETPEQRWHRMRRWVESSIKEAV